MGKSAFRGCMMTTVNLYVDSLCNYEGNVGPTEMNRRERERESHGKQVH